MGTATSRQKYAEQAGLMRTQSVEEGPWPLVYAEEISAWKYSAVLWGFEPRIDYTSSVKARLHPCMNGRYFTLKYDKVKHSNDRASFVVTINEPCFKQETQIRLPSAYEYKLYAEPGPAFSYLKPIQVIGYREGIAVLQVNCSDATARFLVVHMKTETVIGVHKEEIKGNHFLFDCIISPDLSTFILKPNAMFVLNFSRGEYQNSMSLVICKGDKCQKVKSLLNNNAIRTFVVFDPRYKSRRVVIGNYMSNGKDIVCLYDLDKGGVITESNIDTYQTTHNLTFSPDGAYIASLVLGHSVKDGLFNFPKVLVYSGDDLRILHTINIPHLAEVPTLCPTALFPLFSETGSHLAIPYGQQGPYYEQLDGAFVYQVAITLSLQNLCRLTLRKFYDTQDVEKLPLPSKLKSYLRYQPYCT
jgi:hypothetical protein